MFDSYPYDEIMRNDPDGQPTRPTEEDYQAFKAWVVGTWGESVWRTYMGQGVY